MERTALAWRRTALSIGVAALAGARFLAPSLPAAWVLGILGCAATVGLLLAARARVTRAEQALRGQPDVSGPGARLLGATTAATVTCGLLALVTLLVLRA